MINRILNALNNPYWRWVLTPVISLMYGLKGFGFVNVHYHHAYRAWGYTIRGITYLSPGPGWAYGPAYLRQLLDDTYYKFYNPAKGDTIIDLGAGLGEEAMIFASDVGESGNVFSFEANPVTAKALEYAVHKNGYRQVSVFNMAIGGENGTAEIEDNPENYLGNTVGKKTRTNVTVKIPAITLDEFVRKQGITRIDLLKSNIEGAEQFLILGMEQSLKILRTAAISCHDFRFVHNHEDEFYATKEKVISFFTANGFEVMLNKTGHAVNDDMVYAVNRKLTSHPVE